MNKKIAVIFLSISFIIILVFVNIFLSKQNEKILTQGNEQPEITNKENEEVEKVEVLKITSENFAKEVLQSDKPVLIDFYADWCGPCKMLSPVVDEIAQENSNVKVVKVNVDEAQDLAINYQVMSIPTLVVIKDGKEVNRSVGVISKSEIMDMLK